MRLRRSVWAPALGGDHITSDRLRQQILNAGAMEKPGWVSLNFGYMMTETTVRRIVDAVNQLAQEFALHAGHYQIDPATGVSAKRQQAA